jgi:hypothetical protein
LAAISDGSAAVESVLQRSYQVRHVQLLRFAFGISVQHDVRGGGDASPARVIDPPHGWPHAPDSARMRPVSMASTNAR